MNAILVIAPPVGGLVHPSTPSRWNSVAWFGGGAIVGSVMSGMAFGAVGMLLGALQPQILRALLGVTASAGLVYSMSSAIGYPLPVPTRNWVVPRAWGVYGVRRFSFAFGAALGTGFVTRIPYFGYFTLVAVSMVLRSPERGALVMLPFGILRASSVAMATLLAPRIEMAVPYRSEMVVAAALRRLVVRSRSWQIGSLMALSSLSLWTMLFRGA